jgi:glycosyltransferase involved in cell wall biosynthesis
MRTTAEVAAPPMLESLSIVLPAHNEEDNIAEAVRQALAAGEAVSAHLEVIVVDDGSRDSTFELATALANDDDRVRVVHHERNGGYGSAVRSGIAAARMDWVLLTDADLQFDLTQLSEFAPLTRQAELVVGYRAKRNDPFIRRLNALGWNGLVNLLFGLEVRDVDAAFKLIHRRTLDGVELVSTGAAIDAELLAKATDRGAELVQLPVRHLARVAGEPSGANLRVITRAFREIFQIWRGMHPAPMPPLPPAAHGRTA